MMHAGYCVPEKEKMFWGSWNGVIREKMKVHNCHCIVDFHILLGNCNEAGAMYVGFGTFSSTRII